MNQKETAVTALLLVDIQYDFLEAEGLSPDLETFLSGVEKLLNGFRLLTLPVAHIRTLVSPDGSNAMPHRRAKPLCVVGSHGASFPESVKELPGELIAIKQFFNGFADTNLDAWLRSNHVTQVVVSGLFEYACVRETAMDAYEKGYEVFIASDAVTSDNPEHASYNRVWMDNRVARYRSVEEILEQIS